MGRAVLGVVVYIVVALCAVVLVLATGPETDHGFIYELGKCLALAGIMILALQPILASRFKAMERPYGQDVLIRFHKHMGIFAGVALLLHPLLLALGGGGLVLLLSLDVPWYILLGKAGLLVLVIQVIVSLMHARIGFLTFERWRLGHDMAGPLVLVLVFVHSFFAGRDIQGSWWWPLWPAALLVAAGVFVYHRIIRPWRLGKHPWKVSDVKQEAADVWTVKLEPPPDKGRYDYHPGQFHFVTFHRDRGLPEEEHHWTISSSPAQQGFVTSTIKELGDFTRTIGKTKAGDTATVHGPFGRFSHVLHPEEKDLVFIAGGIGITPLISMLRYMRDKGSDHRILFLYGNPDQNSILFRKELAEIEQGSAPDLRVVHVLSDPKEGWDGETGLIDRARIEKYAGEVIEAKTFYLCGPPGLVEAAQRELAKAGVEDSRIHVEIFSFLD
ncbi:MAG: ferric reductase-like transmembrane domain-containing protein [Desulfatibacillaceae bacterium]